MARRKRPDNQPAHEQPSASEGKLRWTLNEIQMRHCHGTYIGLVEAIADANAKANQGASDAPPVERRKLTTFLAGESVKFSFAELDAIGTFLAQHNQRGLAPFFDRPSILGSLVECGRITCLLGAQQHRKHEHLRLAVGGWDARCLQPLFLGLGRLATHFQPRFEEVLWRGDMDIEEIVTEQNYQSLFQKEGWYGCLGEGGPSVVSIGSPKVNHGAEVMLARMLGVEPFRAPSHPERNRFYFLWPPKEQQLPSAFALPPDAIRADHPALADEIANGKASAFYFNGELHPVRSFSGGSASYGVIVAQRRSGGATWVVIAGLSGPSTHAAALRLEQATHPMPISKPEQNSEPLVLGVMAKGKSGDRPVDPREVTKHDWLPTPPKVEEASPARLPQKPANAGQAGHAGKKVERTTRRPPKKK